MRFSAYLKERWLQFLLLIGVLFTIEVFLLVQGGTPFIACYLALSILGVYFLMLYLEYRKKRVFYEEVRCHLDELEQAYLLPELIHEPEFEEGRILYEILQVIEKSMLEHVNSYKRANIEYKDYIELWIHEVKLPIATGKMIVENNKSEVTKSIEEELDKIDDYTEQALYYARSYHVEKDYSVKKVKLSDCIKQVIIKNKKTLIAKKIHINLHDLDTEVYSDSKWILFILNQIVGNAIKYKKEEAAELECFSHSEKEKVVLHIRDNGIGIDEKDVKRVFEKGFTGMNGRNDKKSTGIGLYLSHKLCEKLGHQLTLCSAVGKGTDVMIIFPKGSFMEV